MPLNDEREGRILAGALAKIAAGGFVPHIEDMLTLSRRRAGDPANLFRLQMWMLQSILPLEASTRDIKAQLEAATQPATSAPDDQVLRLQQDLHAKRLRIKAIRGVGDGMVWRALGSDRAAYYLLAQGHQQGAIASSGLPSELQALAESAFTGEGVSVLTSLTNCVRTGDMVSFSESESGDLRTTLAEVKTTKDRSPRFRRQRERMRETIWLVNEREGKLEERNISIAVRDIPQETYLPAVLNALQEAAKRGAAGRTFDGYLRIECVVPDSKSVDGSAETVRGESVRVVEAWEERGDFVVDAANFELKVATPNVAPYSVFPFPEQVCASLLTNVYWIRTCVNVTEVLRRFQIHGWNVDEDPRGLYLKAMKEGVDPRGMHFATIRKSALTVALSPLMCTRMLVEFLKPRSLVREMESILLAGPEAGKDYVLSYYPQERRTWL